LDTKLRNYNAGMGMKVLIFIICIVTFLGSLFGAIFMTLSTNMGPSTNHFNEEDLLFSKSYKESPAFEREFHNKLDKIIYILNEYKSEDFIREGLSINEGEWKNAVDDLFYSKIHSGAYGWEVNMDDLDEMDNLRATFEKDYEGEIAELKEKLTAHQLRNMERSLDSLSNEEGFTYYATDGVNILTNMKDTGSSIYATEFNTKPAYLIYENDKLTKRPASKDNSNSRIKYLDKELEARLDSVYNKDLKVYFSFDNEYIQAKEQAFKEARTLAFRWFPITAACVILTLASFIYLAVTTGRKDKEDNRPVYRIDNVFTEIQLAIIALCFIGGGAAFIDLSYNSIRYGIFNNNYLSLYNNSFMLSASLAIIIGLLAAGLGLLFVLSCIRNIKNRRFIANSLIGRVIIAIVKGLKSIYHGGSIMVKVVLIALAISLVSASVVGAPIAMLLVIILAPRWIKKYEEIKKGVEEVRNGNLTYKIPLEGKGELEQLAKGINEISEASNLAVQNELKNQRLKTELISNVSHDLKTPLTSIITYVDLLKREGLDSPEAENYLDILDQKSQRLQKLTEDLFEAAKASSGAIPVHFEKVDMLSLVNQSLGEMTDKIQSSGLEFKISAEKEHYYVNGDGALLWRVMENLLNNILKYAQEGTRVYIDLKEQGVNNGKSPMVMLEMKNISKTSLNIEASELMERFRRGDESRSSEGSGLGLAIAKDLIRLQEGWFEIKIDGDLFKSVVLLRGYKEEEDNE
jgi:signal transduction histidine kinase